MIKGHNDLPMIMTVELTAQVLGLNKGTVYEMIRQKRIPAVKVGRRLLVPRDALLDWITKEAMDNTQAVVNS
ncbi:helix-turn-helix domain-containing protein [Desulfolucanica intricata]|uniref:helix-turn-helix domain-containing protein n=1 Tax=Desulfolucanica intricata TaxID=1285191 RepID=UPI0008379D34|nr:helix-turn-helix domain-containing protein [Desulfolucanica intricata]